MNPEMIRRMMEQMQQQGFHQMQEPEEPVAIEKLDEFIDRTCEKCDLNLFLLGQDIAFHFSEHYNGIMSFEEARILPQVLTRIQERMNKGEK